MQQMGFALPSHPFWRHEPESAGVINFVKRQGRSPAFLGPSAYETTAHALQTNEKTRNHNADHSTKAKGARGFKKGEFWGAELEIHDKKYKITSSKKYLTHYARNNGRSQVNAACWDRERNGWLIPLCRTSIWSKCHVV